MSVNLDPHLNLNYDIPLDKHRWKDKIISSNWEDCFFFLNCDANVFYLWLLQRHKALHTHVQIHDAHAILEKQAKVFIDADLDKECLSQSIIGRYVWFLFIFDNNDVTLLSLFLFEAVNKQTKVGQLFPRAFGNLCVTSSCTTCSS